MGSYVTKTTTTVCASVLVNARRGFQTRHEEQEKTHIFDHFRRSLLFNTSVDSYIKEHLMLYKEKGESLKTVEITDGNFMSNFWQKV